MDDSDGGNRLFSALAQYTRLFHKPITEEELIHGLALNTAKQGPELFSCSNLIDNFARAAKRAGLSAKLQQRRLEEISALTLPAIIAMKDGSGCILDKIDDDKSQFCIISQDAGDVTKWVDKTALEEAYSGFVFFIGKEFDYQERTKPALTVGKGHWFWSTLGISKAIYWDVVKASLLINIFVLAMPLFTRIVYNRVIPNNAIETLWALGTGVIVIIIIDAFLKFLRTYFVELAAKKSDIIIMSKLYEKVLDLKMEEAPKNIGSFSTNFKEFDSVRNFLTSSVILAFIDLPFTLLFLVVITYLAGPLVVVPVIMMTLLFIYALIIKGPLFRNIYESFEVASRKNSLLIEMLAGLRDIKFLNASGIFQWKWENTVADLANLGIKTRMLSASLSTLTGMLVQLNSVFIIIYGVYLISDHRLSMGGLIAVSILSGRTIAPIGQVVGLLSNYEQTKVAYESIDGIMKKESENTSGAEFIQKDVIDGKIEFKNVAFTYPDSEKPALTRLSFTINKGEKVGIVGRTGSGKSTLQKLMLGLFKPQEGSIFIDDLDISQMSPVFLRKNVSYVPQDFTLITGSLRENLTFKAPYAKSEDIIEAAKTGGLTEFISNHPRGFDAMIEERGANLSGGQKQGIAIARAFIADSPLIFLDEPTNSMDGSTETLVKNNLNHRMQGRTTTLITHKNAMLELVNRILVMEGGNLVFDGSKEGFFKKFSGKENVS
jgi:ATP-binding cassette subfamily C protein LapB